MKVQHIDKANQASEEYSKEGLIPDTLTELRTCLFFEQRRWRHFGRTPDEESMIFINAILRGVREKLTSGEMG